MSVKRIVGVALIFMLGIAVGWIVKQAPERDDSPDPRRESESRFLSNRASHDRSRRNSGERDDQVSEEFREAMRVMNTALELEPQAFAETLENLMREGLSIEEKMQQTAMLAMASTEQAVAFYRYHKKVSGLNSREDSKEWRNFLLMMGQRDGQGFVDALSDELWKGQEACLASVTHGWSMSDPGAAVAWFNDLKEGFPLQDQALSGIMYGLAQSDPANAIEVFNILEEEGVSRAAYFHFPNSLIQHHGFEALDDWLATGPDQKLAEEIVKQGNYRAMRSPPKEFVPWAAEKLTQFPSLASGFDRMSKKWVTQSPQESIQWMNDQAQGDAQVNSSLGIMAGQLYKNGHAEAVDEWLENHPDAAGFEVVKQTRDRLAGASSR